MVVIDLYRLSGGKLIENWDAGQMISEPNEEIITMTNGSTIIEDSVNADESKKLITELYNKALKSRDMVEAVKYLTAGFVEHNTLAGLLSGSNKNIKVHNMTPLQNKSL